SGAQGRNGFGTAARLAVLCRDPIAQCSAGSEAIAVEPGPGRPLGLLLGRPAPVRLSPGHATPQGPRRLALPCSVGEGQLMSRTTLCVITAAGMVAASVGLMI